ncbi:MAG TPA: hypothetical protein VFF30_00105 [Nitrososphaerales archaeon]|nr:hypothetical protein [Nitrososphaerales archaeon]
MATSDGKAYYRITALLKNIGVPYYDLVLDGQDFLPRGSSSPEIRYPAFALDGKILTNLKVIITTRRERISLAASSNIICIEDLGEDYGIAKAKFLSTLYPAKSGDCFVIGIDPGERNGIAAFINHREIESAVLPSIGETILLVTKLLENAPEIRKIVRIGYGNPQLAREIANGLDSLHGRGLSIQFVDERGTSTLSSHENANKGSRRGKATLMRKMRATRDQRAAKLIAFREGVEFQPTQIRA